MGQSRAGAAFVWQDTNRMTSGAPGLGPGLQLRPTPTLAGQRPCNPPLAQAAWPKLGMAEIKGFTHQTGPAPTPGLPASVSGSFRRKRFCSKGCAMPFHEGREGSQPRRCREEPERKACCLPRSRADTGALVLGQRGRLLARWRAAGGEKGFPG